MSAGCLTRSSAPVAPAPPNWLEAGNCGAATTKPARAQNEARVLKWAGSLPSPWASRMRARGPRVLGTQSRTTITRPGVE